MTRLNELHCIHRHNIKTHPACFKNGNIGWPDDKTFEKFSGKQWYEFPGYKIGYFDIETTSDFNADWGMVLCWCIKEREGEIYSSYITKEELFNGEFDKRIVAEFVERLKKYKIIVGYFSTGFDLPFMRSKALHFGLDFPGYKDLYHWDLYYTVRSKLKLSRRSLENVCEYLGIEGKLPLDKKVWLEARYGNPEALKEVLKHCEGDVRITELLHNKLLFTRGWIRKSI